jgi:SpoVK/Ycf46/Vps4 family AAA+-type ATPase
MHQEFFSTSIEHILAELERIDLLIKLHVLQAQSVYQNKAEFQGLFISEQEVERLLNQPIGHQIRANNIKNSSLKEIHTVLSQMTESIAKRMHESSKRGVSLRLEKLSRRFNLTPFDVDTILICLALELDLKYERLFSYVQDDITRKRPSVDLILNLLCTSFKEKLAARKHFDSESPLFKHSILYVLDDLPQQKPPLLSKFLKIDERVAIYLLGENNIDSRLRPFTRLIGPNIQFKDLVLPIEVINHISSIVREKLTNIHSLLFYFKGTYGVGKQSAAEAVCSKLGKKILVIEGNLLQGLESSSYEDKISLIMREATLQESAIYWNGFDALFAEDKLTFLDRLIREIEVHTGLMFLSGSTDWEPTDALHHHTFVPIDFTIPSYKERLELWSRTLNGNTPVGSDVDLSDLSNKFCLSGGQIRDAFATARNRALLHSSEKRQISMNDLYGACRAHSNKKLATLSQKIEPKYRWDDIVLPNDQVSQLREITNHVKYKQLVYGDWGFGRKISLGKGLNVLFHGPSGTGKTMAAEIMANELELDLYKIDLSTVVSKYIGETEKNLSRIFQEAETSNAILFFDEADALFGKRSEVRDSHDRYANVEIGYLLQKMDEYEGIVILATNMKKNMDEAFTRRMHFSVEFPFPVENYRLRIWQNIFPGETPLTNNIDFNFLARKFNFSGGNIKNISLAAAFFAADNGQAVTMENLIQATKRELQKMGKLCVSSDFESYSYLVQRDS